MGFDSNNRPGNFNKSIKVDTSIDDKATVLIITGYVVATPGKLRKKIGFLDADINSINLGSIFPGSINVQEINIHNTTEDTVHVLYAKSLSGIRMKFNPRIIDPAGYGKLTVSFNSQGRDYGKLSEEIVLDLKVADQIYKGKIYLSANIVEDFSELSPHVKANPPQINVQSQPLILKNLEPGEQRVEIVEVKNTGSSDLIIRNIQSYNEKFKIYPQKFIVKAGLKKTFEVKITPDDGLKKLKTTISIISNDPVQSVIDFVMIGEVDLPKGTTARSNANETTIEKANSLISSFRGNDNFVILDVRTKKEYENGCIENAVNLDFEKEDFEIMLQLLDKQKTYAIYCKSGSRSSKAVDIMSSMGFKKLYHIFEGFDGWKEARLKVKDPSMN